ncbi:hypothetical protein J3R82DRAFT_10732 [Butyriboletus roseoflavus]|nr:hypothetical protein J3R82DRAFT_10732 [Butyriboletus roseoflavus]
MRPSPCPPSLSDLPSSPSSAWSCAGSRSPCSATRDHLFPPTPESCFSPAPTIVTPDEFTLQIDVQFDKMVAESPQDDMSNLQLFLRNRGRWEDMHDRFQSPPPVSQESASDPLSWEAIHSPLVDHNELLDLSRYSLLIHEVSLLIGLAADDDHLSSDDRCPLVLDGPKQTPDILPLSITPTKSLASRKHRNASLPHPTNTNVQLYSCSTPISPSVNPHTDDANASLHNEKHPTPIARHKSADAIHRSLSPRRRQGQIFHFEPPLSNAHHRNAVHLDETFSHPREPPPKPAPIPPANRCSSLDRLECSLRKLEAHAPGNHRKSQSEGRSLDQVAQRKDKRPSLPPLPPPRRLRKQRSTHDTMRRSPSRPAVDGHFSGPSSPVSRPIPRTCPAVPLDDEHCEEIHTPGSFMDMDIPLTEEASQKRQVSFRQVTNKEKMKSLLSVASRVSRGVIAWGKNLTGSTKPSAPGQKTTTIQSVRV